MIFIEIEHNSRTQSFLYCFIFKKSLRSRNNRKTQPKRKKNASQMIDSLINDKRD